VNVRKVKKRLEQNCHACLTSTEMGVGGAER
jgi:hypothetical protein